MRQLWFGHGDALLCLEKVMEALACVGIISLILIVFGITAGIIFFVQDHFYLKRDFESLGRELNAYASRFKKDITDIHNRLDGMAGR